MDALKDRAAAGGLWNPKGTEACGFPRVQWWHRKDLRGTEQVAVARTGRRARPGVSSVFAQHGRGWTGKCSEPYPVNSSALRENAAGWELWEAQEMREGVTTPGGGWAEQGLG